MPHAHFALYVMNHKDVSISVFNKLVLSNVLGDQEQIKVMLEGDPVLGILSKQLHYNEYTWLRNLRKHI